MAGHRPCDPLAGHVAGTAVLGAYRQHFYDAPSLDVAPERLGDFDASVANTRILDKGRILVKGVEHEGRDRYRHAETLPISRVSAARAWSLGGHLTPVSTTSCLGPAERRRHQVEPERDDDETESCRQNPPDPVHPMLVRQGTRFKYQQEAEHDWQQEGVHHLNMDHEVDEVQAAKHDHRAEE